MCRGEKSFAQELKNILLYGQELTFQMCFIKNLLVVKNQVLLLIGIFGFIAQALAQTYEAPQIPRFENQILEFESQDAVSFPPKDATLFVGSSSIRLWKSLQVDFPEFDVINRGFGGSRTHEVLYYFDRIVLPYNPKTIVYFAGTNDLAGGVSPLKVLQNIETFIQKVHEGLPETRVLVLSHTIAVSRKQYYDSYVEANRLMEEVLKNYPNASYIDVTTPGLNHRGQPRPEIYTADSLHLNSLGYEMWRDILRPVLVTE